MFSLRKNESFFSRLFHEIVRHFRDRRRHFVNFFDSRIRKKIFRSVEKRIIRSSKNNVVIKLLKLKLAIRVFAIASLNKKNLKKSENISHGKNIPD